MIDIYTISLLDIMPESLKADPQMVALAQAIDPELQAISSEIVDCILFAKIDVLPEPVVDHLATQLHVDWYDSTADITLKRQLVKIAVIVHRYKGTPYAVEQVIQTFFGDGYVQEWFEYGGQPYRFKVVTSNPSVTGDQALQFTRILYAAKNTRSHLETILISLSGEMNLYLGGVVHTGDFLTIRQVV